mgnify:CR=1
VEPRFVIPVVVGSSPIVHPIFIFLLNHIVRVCFTMRRGPLAQLVEQLTLNQRVRGSSPRGPTIKTTAYDTPFQSPPFVDTT